jgi:hypothetical protein
MTIIIVISVRRMATKMEGSIGTEDGGERNSYREFSSVREAAKRRLYV